jgi:hypothetical protein
VIIVSYSRCPAPLDKHHPSTPAWACQKGNAGSGGASIRELIASVSEKAGIRTIDRSLFAKEQGPMVQNLARGYVTPVTQAN